MANHQFGPHRLSGDEVFAETALSLAFVNLKPVVPGHVLVTPRRVVARFADLSADEASDLWLLAKRLGPPLEAHFGASALTLAIQDGPAAGQSVPHCHIHLLPRKSTDFGGHNDAVYDALDAAEREAAKSLRQDLDAVREARMPAEMAAEATLLRAVLAAFTSH